MQKLNYHRIREFVVDFLAINIGLATYSLGWAAFLLPYHITTGGLTGMLAIVYYVTGFPVSYAILIANSILLAFALWKLGWKFVVKTSYAVLALSTYLQLGQDLMTDDAGNLMQILGEGQDSMACVLGAIVEGVGLTFCFENNGSTGGTDIIAASVNKYRNFSLGTVLTFLDLVIIGSCLLIPAFGDMLQRTYMVVFGLCTMVVENFMLDFLMNRQRQSVQFMIFSKR